MPLLTTPALPPGSLSTSAQPVIDGEGLRLRPWRDTDVDAVVAGFADPAIQRWHCRSLSRDEALDWIAQWPPRWRAETDAGWAIVENDQVVGQTGLRHISLAEGLGHVSYWVLPSARGQRIAPRALTALTRWSIGELGLHRLELSHSTHNAASCRVAQRSGYLLEGTKRSEARHTDGWHDMHLHAHLATD
ncbi:acetyltransferase [Actinoplanes lobatus]|uniref:Acetyltransferase n=1 Tax=Actinoplanes lobatus TaxID=113568 RepID=A0A7W7HAL0_9ACTN|nr:GNAT family N-acetyltransferase [Actinoplanes lobatus]MBB4747070.1 RimJ/RimL family protein N-acetyltransferase [Actinoplanes lobatus]GGN55561.1 acetyltransferase [Actinoplanes lobatus]GIE39362.1 acetyltransferase [Actinoplanes lobatus]